MIVLGVESSCDETAVALYHSEKGLLESQVFSQIELHSHFGGVVPELASRDHQRNIVPIMKKLLQKSHIELSQIDVYAYTAGPGLSGALLIGAMFATGLAFSYGKPAVPVHHMEGHLLAPMLTAENDCGFPFLALLISGGHTEFIHAQAYRDYKKLGDTLDDAVGETFDKVAVMLGLDYPGGPAIEKLAEQCRDIKSAQKLQFPRPMTNRQGLDFSFSGLKTHTRNAILKLQGQNKIDQATKTIIAYAFQQAVVETIAIKCARAITQTGTKKLIISGGVAANKALRNYLPSYLEKKIGAIQIQYPAMQYCTDNAAMIALAGYLDYKNRGVGSYSVKIQSRWDIQSIGDC